MVPIDFQPVGRDAIKFAYHLFPNAEFELLYVADLWYAQKMRHYAMKYNREKTLRKEMRMELLNKMKQFASQCDVDTSRMKLTLQGGYPASVINDYANKHKFDLVVMGARGQPQIQYILLGSVAKKILQIITKDVLVVPSK